jgi:hypothetical protein
MMAVGNPYQPYQAIHFSTYLNSTMTGTEIHPSRLALSKKVGAFKSMYLLMNKDEVLLNFTRCSLAGMVSLTHGLRVFES